MTHEERFHRRSQQDSHHQDWSPQIVPAMSYNKNTWALNSKPLQAFCFRSSVYYHWWKWWNQYAKNSQNLIQNEHRAIVGNSGPIMNDIKFPFVWWLKQLGISLLTYLPNGKALTRDIVVDEGVHINMWLVTPKHGGRFGGTPVNSRNCMQVTNSSNYILANQVM